MEIQFEHISKSFAMDTAGRRLVALDDVTFDVQESEIVCLLGPSGCGKSTLLKLVAGLESADQGTIRINGETVTRPHPSRAMVFQDYALFPWLTVEKNVRFGLELASVPEKEIRQRVARFIELVGLKGFEKARPHQLSGGMKQRVGLARALVMAPQVLLMDEPFGALDSFTRMQMQEELINLWLKSPFSTIFVTHDIEEAVYLADRIVVMRPRPGRIKSIVSVKLPRPRQRMDPIFNEIRNDVLSQYEASAPPVEYAI